MAKKTDAEIISSVKLRIEKKDEIQKTRLNVLKYQAEILRQLVPVASEDNLRRAKGLYQSGVAHKLVNFLTGAKLFPTIIDFKHEDTRTSDTARVLAENVSKTNYLMRKKGNYKQAAIDAMPDLILGECYILRSIKKNNDKPQKIIYSHVPFAEMFWKYGEEDIVRATKISKSVAIKTFGKKVVDEVSATAIWEKNDTRNVNHNTTIESENQTVELYGYVHYVNEATKEEYVILGDTVITKNTGDNFPYVYEETEETYNPYNRRIFYQSVEEQYFGYGVLDMVIPLVRLDDTHGELIMKRSINDSDPLTIVSDDDPNILEKKFKNHVANRNARKHGNLFFTKRGAVGSKLEVQTLPVGTAYDALKFVEDFIIDRISMLTDVNLRGLIEFAPTEGQDARRQEIQDRVNLSVLQRNSQTDSKFAKEDMEYLNSVDTEFHNKVINYEQSHEELGITRAEAAEISEDGQIPPVEMKVRDFLKKIDDFDFDITPRLDGVLDDVTKFELKAQREDLSLLMPGTPAHAKATEDYFAKTNPRLRLSENDIFPQQMKEEVAEEGAVSPA